MSKPTFEEVDKHIQAADLAQFHSSGHHNLTAMPATGTAGTAAAPAQLCAIYKIVKPILQMMAMFSWFPSKWTQSMQLYLQAMDIICPGN